MPEPLPETRALNDLKPRNRIQNEKQKNRKTEKQKDKKNFDLKVQGLLRKRWTKIKFFGTR